MLKRYLEYIAAPQTLGAEVTVDQTAEPESPFEDSVRRALEARGHRVASQVGVSGYRIDLAIYSESEDGFVIGIECDGATYHSAPAARDRDWLRQNVLEDLGWRIHRVWSTSWVRNPESELDRIEKALSLARAGSPTRVETADRPTERPLEWDEESRRGPESTPPEAAKNDQDSKSLFDVYKEASLEGFKAGPQLQFEVLSNLVPMIAHVVAIEGPVHEDLVVERIRLRYGLSRVRGSTREHVLSAIGDAGKKGAVSKQRPFLWESAEQLTKKPRVAPHPANPRSIVHIAPTELRHAVTATVGLMYGGDRSEVINETARQLGYDRTGSRISERLGEIYDQMKEERAI